MINPLYFSLLIVIVNTFLTGVSMQLQCRDEENQPVDWFFMYKIPQISQTSNPLIRKGLAYAYITSNNLKDGWKLSAKSVASKTSIPGYTLAPLYTKNDSILWTLYNDQTPNKTAAPNYGHTKGVVMADVRQGIWLIHSVPHYPPSPDHGTDPPERARSERSVKSKYHSDVEYDYPKSGQTYGQSFLCISVDKDQFDLIGTQFMCIKKVSKLNSKRRILYNFFPNTDHSRDIELNAFVAKWRNYSLSYPTMIWSLKVD